MTQSVVTVRLNGTPYQIGCDAGEEEHVAKLGAEVEDIMQSLVSAVGQIGEARLLAMVALILADRASDAQKTGGAKIASETDGADEAAAALEAAASSITDLAARLLANGNAADKAS